METNGDCKRSLPKLREIFTRQRQDSDASMTDCPDIEFDYNDADSPENEIAELYSYTEGPEFQLNLKAWEEVCGELGVVPLWQSVSDASRRSLIIRLSDHLELCHRTPRMRASRAILYIAQGCWGEVQSDREQATWARQNVFLLVQCGLWTSFLQLLHLEIESTGVNESQRKLAVSASLADSADLRVILSVLYTIVETLRVPGDEDTEAQTQTRLCFCDELGQPQGEAEELVAMTLLGMVTRFCNSSAPHFPIRKVLLLLWKVLLSSLGGTQQLADLKNEYRVKQGLEPCGEDTLTIARTMRASSPPASAADLIEQQNNQKRRPLRRQGLMKQSSLDDSVGELDLAADDDEQLANDLDEPPDLPQPPSPRPGTPNLDNTINKGLPWTPKVRQKDIDSFLDSTRVKFVGFQLQGDRTSLAGLPQPIHEGVKVLTKHVYISLCEVQIRQEEERTRNPMSRPEIEIPQIPAEILYQEMLPTLPQCMIALLKILLAAAPTSKAKTDSINIMADVLPEEMPMTVVQSMKLGVDVNRHKEVLVKAVSATLLLLLKHFRINHIYQFEFMSQHLVFANCIPLILKFFNQNIMAYVQAKNTIALLDFPACLIGDPPEMTAEALEAGSGSPMGGNISPGGNGGGGSPSGGCGEGSLNITSGDCCWRNMFSCTNLLRILNKLCKWKHSRIMMLVVFKSAPILKRTLKVKHAMMQLYVLKLLKMQTKYLGRQWRKTNMKTMSAIYQKVRHRLNDDWAYGNDPDARPWDFQAEECALRACVDRFNSHRYNSVIDSDFEPLDNCVTSVLGRPVELTEEFKRHYEVWLQQEVFSTAIDWDQLLASNM